MKEATSILRRATVDQDGVVSGQEEVVVVPTDTGDDIHVSHAEVIQVCCWSIPTCHQ